MVGAEPSSSAEDAGEDLDLLALGSTSTASAALSTDPLLHPHPSPSSTASSPTVSHEVHDAFTEEDGEDDLASVRTPDAPVISGKASPYFAQITVSEPKKHEEPATGAVGVVPGTGSFVSYLITTRVFDGGEFRVRRRFRDVVGLANRLADTHRGLFVPVRPEKSILEAQVMQRHDFVNQRRASLQRYFRRLAMHPTIGRSADLHAFLTEPSGIPTSAGESPRWSPAMSDAMSTALATPTPPAKSGMNVFGMFKNLKQAVTNGWGALSPPPLEEEADTKFLVHKAKLEDLGQQLTTTSQQVEALVSAHDDLRETTAHLGMTFFKLAKFEQEQATCSSQTRRAADINCFANTVVQISRLQIELNAEIGKPLGTIHEYLETMTSARNAFTERSTALSHVQDVIENLHLLQNQVAKLEYVSSRGFDQERPRYQKIEELKQTIRATEDEKNHAHKEYALIKENNITEIERFNKEIRQDLVEMLKGFVANQVVYSDRIASTWAKVAEKTKGYTGRT